MRVIGLSGASDACDRRATMKVRRAWRVLTFCCVCAACYFTFTKVFVRPKLVPHVGDGTFSDISPRGALYAIPGYRISRSCLTGIARPAALVYHLRRVGDTALSQEA